MLHSPFRRPRSVSKSGFALVMLVAALGAPPLARAEPVSAPHVTVELVSENAEFPADTPKQEIWVGIRFDLEEHWHIYWENPGDSGKAPEIQWQLPTGVTVGDIQWPLPKRIAVGPLMNYGYEGTVLLMSPLRVSSRLKAGDVLKLKAKAKWLVCKEVCIPGKADLSLDIPVKAAASKSSQAALFEAARKDLPQSLPESWKASVSTLPERFVLSVRGAGDKLGGELEFFPRHPEQLDNPAAQPLARLADGIRLELKKSDQLLQTPDEFEGLLVAKEGSGPDGPRRGYWIRIPLVERVHLFEALILAFLGGLVLNLMPCVFPVLSMKAMSLIGQAGQKKREVRAHAWVYAAGVVVSFWVLAGVLVAIRAGGTRLGWGFQLQSPIFIGILVLVLFIMGLALLGLYEIGGSLAGVGGRLASRGGFTGSFFTGVLATVVATPCTAPFMGTALGFAATQPPAVAFGVFTFLAFGLAVPYVALAHTPIMARLLPKPGRWMESLKQFLAFPVLGTAIWLLWIFGLQTGMEGVWKLLAALLLAALAMWTRSRWRTGFLAGALAGICLLSALALAVQGARSSGAGGVGRSTVGGVHESGGLRWEPYSRARLIQLLKEGKPVFVDFTAAWCVTCKVNEATALSSPKVIQLMKELGIVPLRADWTNGDPEITQALFEFGRDGVPLYVLYSGRPEDPPVVLPQILTPQKVSGYFLMLGASKSGKAPEGN